MYYSSVVVFVFVIVINLSGKVTGQSPLNRNHGKPPNNPQDVTVNIGNGSYKTNVAVIEDNPNGVGSNQYGEPQPEGLGNRFGADPAYRENQPNPRPQHPDQYHSRFNNNQNTQSSSSGDRTQTQGSTFYAKNNGGASTVSTQGTGMVNAGYGTDNHNQIVTNSRPILPLEPNSAYNTRNNGGTFFVPSDGIGVVNVGYGKDNHNQILVERRPSERHAPVNGGRRATQAESATKAFNNDGYKPNAYNNQVIVNGRPVQPDHNDGIWSTFYINNQRIHILNTGRPNCN